MTSASHIANPGLAVHYRQQVRALNVQFWDMGRHIKYANSIAEVCPTSQNKNLFGRTCVKTGIAGNLEILTAVDNGMHQDGVWPESRELNSTLVCPNQHNMIVLHF